MSSKKSSILPIAVMALAIVAFLFVINWAITPNQKLPWLTNSSQVKTTNTNTSPEGTNVVLAGKVWIYGCPAQRVNTPCGGPPPTSDTIVVYSGNRSTVVAKQQYGQNGSFHFSLPAGTYILALGTYGLSSGQNERQVTLTSGHDVTDLSIQLDSGIR